jgi:hypothetical protein
MLKSVFLLIAAIAMSEALSLAQIHPNRQRRFLDDISSRIFYRLQPEHFSKLLQLQQPWQNCQATVAALLLIWQAGCSLRVYLENS